MLACAVGVTAAALSGSSWSGMLDKFRDLEWPSSLASSRPPAPQQDVGYRMAGPADAAKGKTAPAKINGSGPSPVVANKKIGADDIQLRLRELGATYYLLETWGNGEELYRFSCKMAIEGNTGFVRHFEAVDADPLRAMLLVLRQVETWRDG